ncbi:MAG: glycosyltransferase family 2 protein [Pseudomonadota bacterium]
MPPRPHVTVLMAVRDGARYLPTQLESIAAQENVDWALWASDDGSSDQSVALLHAFAKRKPGHDIRILNGPRSGPSANFLSLLCRDDIPKGLIALADQDDKWFPGKLARAADLIRDADGPPRLYGAHWVIADQNLAPIAPSPRFNRPPSLENALVQNIVSGHTTVLNSALRTIIRDVGPVSIPFHDWWIYQLAAAVGAEVVLDPEPVLLYRQHDANVAGTKRGIGPGVKRVRGLLDGTLAGWMRQNIHALRKADAYLTRDAEHLLSALPGDGAISLSILRRTGLHRQTPGGTAALYLAAGFGRL